MKKDDSVRLRHMLDAAIKAVGFTSGKGLSDIESDEILGLAIVRLLEIIGEAAKSVSQSTRERYQEIPWKQIAGVRDRLIHGYYDVDHSIVWSIVTSDLPELVVALKKALSEMS